MTWRDVIVALVAEHGLSGVARAAKVSRSAVWQWKKGRTAPSTMAALRIARVFRLTALPPPHEELFDAAGDLSA